MTLEKAIPLLKKDKSIKRTRKKSSMIVKFKSGKYLCCKYIFESGKEFTDTYYKFTNEDLFAENWEVTDEII